MAEAVLDKPNLSPEAPDTWLDHGYEPLYAISWRDYQDVQLAALKTHFAKVSGSVAALDKLAGREGIKSIDSLEEGLPLLFDHRVLKNYPLSLIEKRDVGRLNAWLDRLTTHDLSKVDLAGVATVDSWLDRLDDFGMLIGHSSGTTGKLSFVPRSQVEFPSWQRSYYEAQRATTGVDAYTDKVETFFPGYRGGHQMMMKMLELFNVPAAGGPEHYHTLYPHHISSDLLSLAARMQVAEDRGELDKLGLDPALLKARQDLIAQGRRREKDIETWFFQLFEGHRGRRVKLGGSFGDLIQRYRQSPRMLSWGDATLRKNDRTLAQFLAANARFMVADFRRGDFISLRDSMARTPSEANNWSVGLLFSLPLGNRNAKGLAGEAKYLLEANRASLSALEQNVVVEVRAAVRDIDQARRQVAAARKSRELAERNLEAERKKFENGMSTTFEVTRIHSDLSNARTLEILALAAYSKAVAGYHYVVGDNLAWKGIKIEGIPESTVPDDPARLSWAKVETP